MVGPKIRTNIILFGPRKKLTKMCLNIYKPGSFLKVHVKNVEQFYVKNSVWAGATFCFEIDIPKHAFIKYVLFSLLPNLLIVCRQFIICTLLTIELIFTGFFISFYFRLIYRVQQVNYWIE